MGIGFVIMVAVDVVLAVLGLKLHTTLWAEDRKGISLTSAILLFIAAVVIHWIGASFFVIFSGVRGAFTFLIQLACGFPMIIIYGALMVRGASNTLMKFEGDTILHGDLGKARRLAKDGDIDDAVAEYLWVWNEEKRLVGPLLDAAGVLAIHERTDEAIALLNKGLDHYKTSHDEWIQCAERLVKLYSQDDATYGLVHGLKAEVKSCRKKLNIIVPDLAKKQEKEVQVHHQNKAKALRNSGDWEGAVEAYMAQYKSNPKSPRPLFAAANLLEREGRPYEAADLYREMMREFKDDLEVWAELGIRLAKLLEGELADFAAARQVYREVSKQGVKTKAGREASIRMHQLISEEYGQNN